MGTKKKPDLAAAVAAGANAGTNRFASAGLRVQAQPTAYSVVEPPPAAGEVPPPAATLGTPSPEMPMLVMAPMPLSHQDSGGAYYAEVPIAEIQENPFNARRIYRQERIEKLAVSISAQGQMIPGLATIRDGKTILAAGHYRLRSLRFAGKTVMKVMLYPNLSDQQLYEMSFKENDERDEQSALDNAMAWNDLLQKKVYSSQKALADAIGKDPSVINRTLGILALSQPVIDLVGTRPGEDFALTVLYELALLEKVGGGAVALEYANRVITDGIGRSEIQARREQIEQPRTRKPKASSRQYRIPNGDAGFLGTLKDWDDGRVRLEVTLSDPTRRHELVEYLKGHFSVT